MGYADQLTEKDLIQMYRWLVLIRAFENHAAELWTSGRLMESPHGSQGQEAMAVGACYGLRQEDQVLPSLRTRGAFLVRGIPARVQMAGMYAKATEPAGGKATAHHMGDPERGVLLGSGIVGASITVAAGAALAFKLQRKDNIVVDFFGDGAAQRGDFHEGLNFGAVFKLPVVFVLENSQYAEMTPLAKHFTGSDFACRAQGYGFPGIRLDGNGIFAVYEAVQAAAARARAGEGPTLLECVTYREAIREALREEMRRDDRVFVLGEDVAAAGGVFKVTQGLLAEFGPERIFDTPLSESAIVGAAVGASLMGMRPVAEVMFADFTTIAMDAIVNHAVKIHYMSGGEVSAPLVVRMA